MDAIATARLAMESVRADLVGRSHGQVEVVSVLHYGAVDRTWLASMRDVVVSAFAALEWPDAQAIAVYADSSHRVDTNGGWNYFRG